MRKSTEKVEVFQNRRTKIVEKLNGAALIVAAHPEPHPQSRIRP